MGKPAGPVEFRMSEADFDKMMRGALSAPAPEKTIPKKVSRTSAPKKKAAKRPAA